MITLTLFCIGGCSIDADQPTSTVHHARIATLAPHLTELVFAAGAGDKLVGVSAYSDYPAEALELPLIGDAFAVDHEQLAMLNPDLLLAWQGGTPAHVVDELRHFGYTVEVVQINSLADVAGALRRIGELTDSADTANDVAFKYTQGLQAFEQRYANADDVRVFYQVDKRPLYTINNQHYVSELIDLCGGSNVFSDLDGLAPTVSVEAVVERDPEAMFASSDAGDGAFDQWNRWPHIAANRYKNRFLMPADEIGRATPRLLIAAKAVCDALQVARANRDSA
ncbi:MAG: cobalamin-binding protein [Woeseiaceae bacterium]|nr:cobalamin-binding protein [Woeseiaceae bacterium]MDX2607483.1 cobalamin-binding protein [Woeseiaceae bacterium]